jgi:hypothetical protein
MKQFAAAFDSGQFLLIRASDSCGAITCPGAVHNFIAPASSNDELGAAVRRCLADSKTITKDELEARPSYDLMDNAEVRKKYRHTSKSDVYQYMIHCNIETMVRPLRLSRPAALMRGGGTIFHTGWCTLPAARATRI